MLAKALIWISLIAIKPMYLTMYRTVPTIKPLCTVRLSLEYSTVRTCFTHKAIVRSITFRLSSDLPPIYFRITSDLLPISKSELFYLMLLAMKKFFETNRESIDTCSLNNLYHELLAGHVSVNWKHQNLSFCVVFASRKKEEK